MMRIIHKQTSIIYGLAALVLLSHASGSRAERSVITPVEQAVSDATANESVQAIPASPSSAAGPSGPPVYDVTGFPSLVTAISAVGPRNAVLVVSNEQPIWKSLIIPSNIHLRFSAGGLLIINPGTTVTIQGALESGLHQIFSGTGLVDFAAGAKKEVYPQWWGAKGDGIANDTRAVQQAINAIARAKGGDVVFVKGTYLVDTIVLDSYVNIVGQGWTSIIRHSKYGYTYCFSINPNREGTSNPADNKHDIRISNIQLRGSVDVDGFLEAVHLLNINAASNVVISKCYFVGWRGDAIYLGSSNVAKTERHNRGIVIADCIFDGINNENRNAISIIDGSDIVIRNCSFVNCTRKNMPGAIDLEPDIDNFFAIIRNITISDNSFKNVGGFGGVISVVLLLGQTDYTVPPENIVISNNTIDLKGSASGADGIFLYQVQRVNDSTPKNRITVSGNTIRNTRRPFKISGMKGVVLVNNTFERSTHAGLVASAIPISTISHEKCQNIEFVGNTFAELGSVEGTGISVLNDVDYLDFIGNTFVDVGLPSSTVGKAISFQKGTADWIRIESNHFSGKRTKVAASIEPQAKTYPAHNKIRNNTFAEGQKILFPIVQTN